MLHNVAARREFSSRLKYIILFLLIFSLDVSHSKAQEANFWSAQEKIPNFEIENYEQPPFMIADQNHVVHAFNSQTLTMGDKSSPKAIFYRQWTLERGWTQPNDILIDESGGDIEVVGVSSDQSGMIHLVFQKNNNDLYYTNTYLSNANDPGSWSEPVYIAGQTLKQGGGLEIIGAIASNETGSEIIIVYSGEQYGDGLYFTRSNDHGISWTEPYPLYLTGDKSFIVVSPSMYLGQSGILHAVWSTFDKNGFGGPGYYSNLNPDSGTWSEPKEIDQPGIRTPTVIEYKGNLFIAYYHHSTNSRWWRISKDDGETWTDPAPLYLDHVGTNGGVSFVVDSNETLHAFFGGRVDSIATHGIWHSTWLGTTWSPLDFVVKGHSVVDVIGGNGFDPTFARSVVSNGNEILVSWGTDGGAGSNGAWYSYKRLEAPELPSVVLESPTVVALSTPVLPIATITPTSHQNALPVSEDDLFDTSPGFSQNPQTYIFLGLIPTIFFLTGLLVIFYILHHKK